MEDILKNHIRYVDSLSIEIQKSLKYYTTELYVPINEKMRNSESLNEYEIHKNNIDKAFLNSPLLSESINVYRGLKFDIPDHIDTEEFFVHHYNPKNLSYISTSYDINEALSFGSSTPTYIMKILVPEGTHILPLESISAHPDEKEILLDRNGTLTLTSVSIKTQIVLLNCVYTKGMTLSSDKQILSFIKNIEDTQEEQSSFNKQQLVETLINAINENNFELEEDDFTFINIHDKNEIKEFVSSYKDSIKELNNVLIFNDVINILYNHYF